MLRVLRNVRRALKLWRAMPAAERSHYRARAERIRALVGELGGDRAVGYVFDFESAPKPAPAQDRRSPRPRREVLVELQAETTELLRAISAPASSLVVDSAPRSARLGAKVARSGIRVAARRATGASRRAGIAEPDTEP
ncbi:MAG TPA: hypothetical protein VHU13_05875 [Solirubrobacteraceae bacterium]|jgi:hypothetical protein|nr:hypothetical protein [Solirubrobacteraceae bacterium]